MIFQVDEDSHELTATIAGEDGTETYACSIRSCDNPVCICETIYLTLTPVVTENHDENPPASHEIVIDIKNRKPDDTKEKNRSKDSEYGDFFVSKLSEEDFKFLFEINFESKNQITESAGPDSIEAYFDYADVETEGTMYAYNQVLPYGDQLLIMMDGKRCIIMDHHCILPKCNCKDISLFVHTSEESDKKDQVLASASVNYVKRNWEPVEGHSMDISAEELRSTIEEQIPDFYQKVHHRHQKLKSIYAHCKRKNYSPTKPLPPQKVGRNDPCPCGSGKKYKKCCSV